MSNKYVLLPDGSIISPEKDILKKEEISELSIKINKDNIGDDFNPPTLLDGLGLFLDGPDLGSDLFVDDTKINQNLINVSGQNSSFDFIDPETKELKSSLDRNVHSFKSFTSFQNQSRIFANELELLGAHKLVGSIGSIEDVDQLISFKYLYFIDYIIEITTMLGVVELLTSIDEFARNDNDLAEKTSYLTIGKNTFPVTQIFSEYFLKVINYPTKLASTSDRLSSFFLGLSLFLGGDPIVKDSKRLIYENIGIDNYLESKRNSLLGPIISALFFTLEGLLISTAKDNVIDLLIRKFQMERHWHENYLFKAKSDIASEKYFSQFYYYYFKFAVERIQVGLKYLNYNIYNLKYMPSKESPSTRYGLSVSNDIKKVQIKTSGNNSQEYNWNSEVSWNVKTQSIRNRALPQGLQMPVSFLANKILNKNLDELTNETSLISVDPSIKQNFVITKNSMARIDKKIVQQIENHLESEYVPFYFHDIRTNEIISFHAFIENLTDSFNPQYNPTSGFGRIDDVQSYVKTTRTINFDFMMVSTSQEDFDLLWYQANKLISMCYPQWSDAYVPEQDKNFKYPFSQMPTASPLIRLRVGDLIKGNYSRQSLSRLHGIGDRRIDEDLKNKIFEGEDIQQGIQNTIKKYNENIDKQINKLNKEQKNLQKNIKQNEIKIANIDKNIGLYSRILQVKSEELDENIREGKKLQKQHEWYINRSNFFWSGAEVVEAVTAANRAYEIQGEIDQNKKSRLIFEAEKNRVRTHLSSLENNKKKAQDGILANERKKQEKNMQLASIPGKIKNDNQNDLNYKYYLAPGVYKEEKTITEPALGGLIPAISEKKYTNIVYESEVIIIEKEKTYYKVKLVENKDKNTCLYVDPMKVRKTEPIFGTNKKGIEKEKEIKTIAKKVLSNVGVTLPTSPSTTTETIASSGANLSDPIIKPVTQVATIKKEGDKLVTTSISDSVNNPFTAAFESASGRGLAGFITNLSVNSIMDMPWETSRIGSKGPMHIKISIGFTPIHDIPPGLDHDGMMRAPVYNLGRLMNELFDDTYKE